MRDATESGAGPYEEAIGAAQLRWHEEMEKRRLMLKQRLARSRTTDLFRPVSKHLQQRQAA
jgi:hypothetical protein